MGKTRSFGFSLQIVLDFISCCQALDHRTLRDLRLQRTPPPKERHC
jgi:hypothetical protein